MPSAPRNQIATAAALAAALGRNKGQVSRWMAREDWQFGKPPWPASIVARVAAWATANLSPVTRGAELATSAPDEPLGADPQADAGAEPAKAKLGPLKQADLELKIQRRVNLELDNREKSGRLVDRGEVEQAWAEYVTACKAELMTLPAALAPRVIGRPEPEVHQIIEQAIRNACSRLTHA